MMTKPAQINPTEALERLFEVIREEAAANPTFTRRMLDALGVTVNFTGPDATLAADPVLIAARLEHDEFREMFQTFADADLRKMLKNFGLATAEQIKNVKTKPKKIGFIELLWDGARRKIAERSAK